MAGQHDLGLLRDRYRCDRHVFLPRVLSRERAASLALTTSPLSSRRVVTGDHPEQWDELKVDPGHELAAFLSEDSTLDVVRAALCLPAESRPASIRTWANRYRLGEHIPRHTDAGGTTQMVVCLAAPPVANGGTLMLATASGDLSYTMAPGDAVLLQTTVIEHWTTPLVATAADPRPVRLVGVGRYHWPD